MSVEVASNTLNDRVAVASWVTVLTCAGLATSDFVLALVTPGYDLVGETSSQLMSPDAKYSTPARIFLGLYAVLLLPFALLLPERFSGRTPFAVLSVAGIWVHMGASLVSALALNDSDAKVFGGVTANEIHDEAAIAMFGAAAAALVGAAFGYRSSLRYLRVLTFVVVGVLAVIGPLFVAEVWTDVNGLAERIMAVSFVAWIAVTAWSWRREPAPSAGSAG